MPMDVSSSRPSNKVNIFLGLIEYELNSLLGASHIVDYISVHIRFDLERYLLNIQRLLSLLPALFTKDCVLVSCYSFAKDCCPCLSLFICKGPLSLSFCYSFAKDCCICLVLFAIHLQNTAVLV